MIHVQIVKKKVISFIILVVFADGKYLAKNAFANKSQMVIDTGGCEFNHAFSLSLSVKGNNLNLIASSDIPLYLNVSQISKKLAIWTFGSSLDNP